MYADLIEMKMKWRRHAKREVMLNFGLTPKSQTEFTTETKVWMHFVARSLW